jgi:hypothetical protein
MPALTFTIRIPFTSHLRVFGLLLAVVRTSVFQCPFDDFFRSPVVDKAG